MGPGGPHGLQLRWRVPFGMRGGFDSLALPPLTVGFVDDRLHLHPIQIPTRLYQEVANIRL